MSTPALATSERSDLVESLRRHRWFLRQTVRGLTDGQARARTTVSELTLGGLISHVCATEEQWARFAAIGAGAVASADDPGAAARWAGAFRLAEDEHLADVLAAYEEVAARTDELVLTCPDLDASHELPVAPWFEPGAQWSVRRVVLHVIAETSQHAGHADILREALDGARTMG